MSIKITDEFVEVVTDQSIKKLNRGTDYGIKLEGHYIPGKGVKEVTIKLFPRNRESVQYLLAGFSGLITEANNKAR